MLGLARQKKLQDVEERLEKLEREFKALQLDWNDVYDKIRRTMGRIVKRAEKAPIPQIGEEEGEADETTGQSLSPRQLQVTREIMRRRNRSTEVS